MLGNSTQSERSEDDWATRAFLAGVALVACGVFIAASPILIGGFFTGLFWYGAYVEDGEPNGERIVWPVVISLAVIIFFLGFFPPFDRHFEGILFRDLLGTTLKFVAQLMGDLNEVLPAKFAIHRVSVRQIRVYGWCLIPVAALSFIYLYLRAAGRGVFLYRWARGLCAPLRHIGCRLEWILGLGTFAALAVAFAGAPDWFRVGSAATFLLLLVYHFSGNGFATGQAMPEASESVVLGHKKGSSSVPARLSGAQLNHHVHVVGASGFGKSVLLSHLIKNRIMSGSGLLFIDLKTDFESIRQVVSTAKAAGRLDDLRIFSCGNPEFSSPYNVLARGSANQLRDRILGALDWSEEYYKNEASSYLLKLLRGLVFLRDHSDRPFDLLKVLRCAENPFEISGLLTEVPDAQAEIKLGLKGLVAHLSRHDNFKALQGLRSQLESLVLSDFGHLLTNGDVDIDLFEAIRQKKIVFVLLDSRTYGESAKALGKLILQDLKAAAAKIDNEVPRSARAPFTVVVDEFSDLASEDFIGFLDRARSSGIGVVVAHQEIADLSRISPEFASRLMNSTSNLFAFLQKNPSSSELVAGICGTRKAKAVTEQAKSDWLFGDERTGMKSIREVEEYIVHPNVIRSLAVGECVLVQKYPRSTSMVVQVRPEASDYISDEEVRHILAGMGRQPASATPRKELVNCANAGNATDSYWCGERSGE